MSLSVIFGRLIKLTQLTCHLCSRILVYSTSNKGNIEAEQCLPEFTAYTRDIMKGDLHFQEALTSVRVNSIFPEV